MTPEEFRQLGHKLVDWVADYRAHIEDLPVMSQVAPGDIKSKLPKHPPERGESLDKALNEIAPLILPGITHWNHPSFFAYFPSNAMLPSVLADLLCAGLGAQGMSWQTSPAATELEEVVMDWLRQMTGLSENFTGTIHDTASTATLCSLLCARERSTNYSQDRGGFHADAPFVVYCSEQAHSSVLKAAMLAGFGRDHLRSIDTDENCALRLDLLEAAIKQDVERGLRPAALVASVGTTNSTAFDPVAGMAQLARKYQLWLHVDAAMAGVAMILPEYRALWEGVEAADSIVMNPHKWLGAGCDLSTYFVRDPQHLIRVMSTNPAYLQTGHDTEVKNFRDWGIPLGRRFRSLKLWFLIRDEGVEGIRTRLRRDLDNARFFEALVDAAPDWEKVAPVQLQTICIRHKRAGMSEPELAAHNLRIATTLNNSGKAYLTPSVLKRKQILRVSIGSHTTERSHVEALWRELRAIAAL